MKVDLTISKIKISSNFISVIKSKSIQAMKVSLTEIWHHQLVKVQ